MKALFFVGLSLILVCLVTTAQSMAQDLPPSCDPDFMDVLEERAWMEGKREMELNQKLILKPDSTLEYSCFDDRISELSSAGAQWSNRKANMSAALQDLVVTPKNAYLQGSFSHTLGGGTYTGNPPGNCSVMKVIWDFLKCDDFDKEDFMTFEDLAGKDPRTLPQPCNEQGRSQKWQDALQAVYPPPATPAANGGMDKTIGYVKTHLKASCARTQPIPTGIEVVTSTGKRYEEHVCFPPGCSYDPDAGRCKN